MGETIKTLGNKNNVSSSDTPPISNDFSDVLSSEHQEEENRTLKDDRMYSLTTMEKNNIHQRKVEIIRIIEHKGDALTDLIATSMSPTPSMKSPVKKRNNNYIIAIHHVSSVDQAALNEYNKDKNETEFQPQFLNNYRAVAELPQTTKLSSEEKSLRRMISHNNKISDLVKMPSDPNLSATKIKKDNKEKACDDFMEYSGVSRPHQDESIIKKKSVILTPQTNQSKECM